MEGHAQSVGECAIVKSELEPRNNSDVFASTSKSIIYSSTRIKTWRKRSGNAEQSIQYFLILQHPIALCVVCRGLVAAHRLVRGGLEDAPHGLVHRGRLGAPQRRQQVLRGAARRELGKVLRTEFRQTFLSLYSYEICTHLRRKLVV